MNVSDQFALLRAAGTLQALEVERTSHPEDLQRARTYLLHRAALTDRTAPAFAEVEDPFTSAQDAEDTARRLLEHDRAHGTSRGPVPAADTRWDTDLRGYARQEHAVIVLDENDLEGTRG